MKRLIAISIAGVILLLLAFVLRAREERLLTPSVLMRCLEELRTERQLINPNLRDVESAYLERCREVANKTYGHDLRSIAINPMTADPHDLNMYFANIDPNGPLQQFANNAAYTGYNNIIVVDMGYLNAIGKMFPHLDGVVGAQLFLWNYQSLIQASTPSFRIWILGHEFGHLARRDGARHFRFSWRTPGVYTDGDHKIAEEEADRFASDNYDVNLASIMWDFFSYYVYFRLMSDHKLTWDQVTTMAQGKPSDMLAKGYTIVCIAENATHPPIPIRVYRMLKFYRERRERKGKPVKIGEATSLGSVLDFVGPLLIAKEPK
jgi:hypothetical protein